MRVGRFVVGFAVALACASAAAEVKREGDWPETEKKVSLDLGNTRRDVALKKLADEAGWSVVSSGVGSDPISVSVKDQPASKLLDVVLSDGKYVAKRDGTLVSIKREEATDAATPALSIAVPAVPAGTAIEKIGRAHV